MKKKIWYVVSTIVLFLSFFALDTSSASANGSDGSENIETAQVSSYTKTITRFQSGSNYPASIKYQEIRNQRLYKGTLWYVSSKPTQGGYYVTYRGTLFLDNNYWPTNSKNSK